MALISSGSLGTGLVAAGDTPNILDRGMAHWDFPAMVRLTTTVGSTPTATYAVNGSLDNVNFYPLVGISTAAPTVSAVTFTVTTATVTIINLPAAVWRYLKVTLSAVTNVTTAVDAFGGIS
jgi:hypothetical protein